VDEADRARRWALVLPHRDRLLRLARQLVRDPGDAEECVQEAMARCVTFPALDETDVAGFLVTTTRRLCADHHRAQARTGRLAARLTGRYVLDPAPDDVVCDRAEAAWVSERLSDLPQRQRDVVLARAAGHTPQEIADRLKVSYKTVETLLYRVRVRARTELERAYGAVALAAARWSRTDLTPLGAASLAVVTAGVAIFAAAPPAGPPAAAPPQAPRAVAFVERVRPQVAAVGDAVAVPSATPSARPSPRPSSSPSRTQAPCPYQLAPRACFSPDPSGPPPGLAALDCVRYGIDRESGFACNSAPEEPPGNRHQERPEGET
jgi:RNA polymerase sigma-70 factor (ECF subfamily)